jgi:serine protease Do
MNLAGRLRQPRFLTTVVLLLTLGIGIVIGTLVNTGVLADKGGQAVTDAAPLVIPSPVKLASEFTKLAKVVEPAVVHITSEPETQRTSSRRNRPAPDDEEGEEGTLDPFRFFRGRPLEIPQVPREASGSGFIVDPKGYIITNHHVVEGSGKIRVKLHDVQQEHKARLIGFDPDTDLAVLKIDAERQLPYLRVGNSDAVEVGDWAVAIGSPFGLEASVTAGIISAKGRIGVGRQFQAFLQTDAAINPGNSGGPLVNIRGEVIGVNTAIATRSGGNQGVGFALPVNMAVKVYNQLVKHGRIVRGSIGVSFGRNVTTEQLKAFGLSNGVYLDSIEPGGPAEKAGLKPEDVIVGIDGKPVKDGDDLVDRISDTPIGTRVNVTVDRRGKKMDFPVTVADRTEVFASRPEYRSLRKAEPEDSGGPAVSEAKFGIRVRPVTAEERTRMKIEGGVQVTQVTEDSFAAEIGLQERDVILSINRVPINSIDDIRQVQSALKPGDAVVFRLARANPLARIQGSQAPAYSQFSLAGVLPKQ